MKNDKMTKIPLADSTLIEDGNVWFVGQRENCIFSIRDGICGFLTEVEGYPTIAFRSFIKMQKNNNRIILFPCYTDSIVIYDLEENRTEKIVLKENQNLVIRNVFKIGNICYLVSDGLHEIMLFDVDKEEIIERIPIVCHKDKIGYECIVLENEIFIPLSTDSKVVVYNTVSRQFREYVVMSDLSGYNTITFDGVNFWLTGKGEGIVKWNKEDNSVSHINLSLEGMELYSIYEKKSLTYTEACHTEEGVFEQSFCSDRYIIFNPLMLGDVLAVDRKTDEIQVLSIEKMEKQDYLAMQEGSIYQKYRMLYGHGNELWVQSNLSGNIYKMDCENLAFRQEKIILADNFYSNLAQAQFNKGEILYENERTSIDILKNLLLANSNYEKSTDNNYHIGMQICLAIHGCERESNKG